MQENNPKDPLNEDSSLPVQENSPVEVVVPVVISEPEETVTTTTITTDTTTDTTTTPAAVGLLNKYPIKKYALTFFVVLVMLLGLVFILEKEGRLTTGIFASLTGANGTAAVAMVNGNKIVQADFASSMQQLLNMAAAQGADVNDETVVSELKTQAIDTLVNGELLRQSALDQGFEAPKEDIDARYKQIGDEIGGAEVLLAKMAEFGITEKSLRRDIENEILIQGLFDNVIKTEDAEITEAEIKELYEQSGGEEAGLPPLAEVRDKVVEQIERNRQQVEISKYLENLRTAAEIEILI